MTSIVGIIKEIAKNEVNRLHILELGVVESVSVRSTESDKTNYECSVILKGRIKDDGTPLKIEHVPIATQHSGSVAPLYVDDLVIVGFLNGNIDTPVVLGRLYSAEKRVPVHKDCEYLVHFEPDKFKSKDDKYTINFHDGSQITSDKSRIKLQLKKTNITTEDNKITITTGKTKLVIQNDIEIYSDDKITVKVNGDVTVSGKKLKVDCAELDIESKTDVTIKCVNAKVIAKGSIDLGDGGTGVVTEASHKCFITGAPHVGSTTVKAKL